MPKIKNNIEQGMGLWAAEWQWLEKNIIEERIDDKNPAMS